MSVLDELDNMGACGESLDWISEQDTDDPAELRRHISAERIVETWNAE